MTGLIGHRAGREDAPVEGVVVDHQDRHVRRGSSRCALALVSGSARLRSRTTLKWNLLPCRSRSRARCVRPSAPPAREIVRPRPVPPYLRVIDPSAWRNVSKIACLLLRRHADAGVRHAEPQIGVTSVAARLRPSDHLAVLGELDGVADQVHDHLAQPAGIADQRGGTSGRMSTGEFQPLLVARGASSLSVVARQS